jgi:predicted RecA/RadA family phage recombinase
MANLTADREDFRKEGELVQLPVAASTKLFKGSIVALDSSGYAVKGQDTASTPVAGIAYEQSDNSAGAAGDKKIRVWRTGVFSLPCASATQAWVGQTVYAVDDNLVALADTTTNDQPVGTVVEFVSATEVKVQVNNG